ncbi:MAG: PAS domain S-box protein [Ferruginibacter sp.]
MKNLHAPYLKKNEFLLYLGEDKYRALIENSIHSFFLTTPDGNILETNHVAITMFGYSKNEFLSLNKHKLFDHTDENLKLAFENCKQNGYISVEATGIKKNGEHFPIELSSVIYAEPNGEVRTSTMVYDMSKRKYADNQPATKNKNELDFKPVIESITDGFFTLDNNWIITYWNKEVEKISGIMKDEITGKSFLDFFKNIGNQRLYSECRRAKRENISIRFEEYYELSHSWIEIDAYPSETGLTVFCKNITEQKTAEAAMKISNERYDLVVKATNDLVWDWDIITGEIYRNSNGIKRVYGHSSNEAIKTNQLWASNIHPEDREEIDRQIAYYISSENEYSFNFEYRFKREDGNYNYINDKGYIIRNELGIVIRMIGAARDITEQKQIARNIEESEQRYKMFVQQSTEGIWRIELDEAKPVSTPVEEMIAYCMTNAYLAECNDAFAKMYGYESAEKIIGVPLHQLMPPENIENIEHLKKFFSNNFKIEDELSHEIDEAGNQLVFVNNMIGIVERGHIKRAWGTQRNITQQKKAEQLLLASEEQYRYLFNNNPSCIFIWDPETLSILEVNQAAVELYGYSRNEFLQLTALDIMPSDQHAKFLETLSVAIRNEIYKKTMTCLHINKKGEGIFMEISSHNIFYHGKKAVLAIGNNVTDKIQLENSLNEERQIRQKQITDAVITGQERERSELGEELHDNINQILASTRLYIECAIADENPRKDLLDKGRVLLDSAMKEIRKLSRTLLPPSLGEISLIEALNDLTKDIFMVNPIKISKDWKDFNENGLSQKLKLTIFRIVQEQLNNIYKHAKAKNVAISLKKKDDQISLMLKDDGIGFDTLTKRSGVGLRNIASRAEVNNGTINIESRPGAGCILTVQFLIKE